MSDFFKGWRRKIGVVALVLACVFAAGWLRSLTIRDVFTFKKDKLTIAFRSFEGGLGWQRFTPTSSLASTGWRSDNNFKFSFSDPWWRFDNIDDDEIDWRWDRGGFSFGAASKKNPEFLRRRLELWTIPYWSIVIPLTLLSAYLLLTKPRAARKNISPACVDGLWSRFDHAQKPLRSSHA